MGLMMVTPRLDISFDTTDTVVSMPNPSSMGKDTFVETFCDVVICSFFTCINKIFTLVTKVTNSSYILNIKITAHLWCSYISRI